MNKSNVFNKRRASSCKTAYYKFSIKKNEYIIEIVFFSFLCIIELNLKLFKIKINLIFSHGEKFVLGHRPCSCSHRHPTIQQFNTTTTIQYNALSHLCVLCWRLLLSPAALDSFVSYAGGFDSISHCYSSMERLVTSTVKFCTIDVCIHALMNAVGSVERLHKTDLLHIKSE